MNRKKKLPKVILPRTNALHEADPTTHDQIRSSSMDRGKGIDERAPSLQYAAGKIIDIALRMEASSAPVAIEMDSTISKSEKDYDIYERSIARKIVERYANLSAISGFIPVPILNVAGIAATVIRMLKALSRHYGIPFDRDRARLVVTGLTGGIMPAGFATVVSSTFAYIVPGSNLIGLAVCSVTASSFTRYIGYTFIELFESGTTWRDIPAIEKS